jgi:hypothetical protein
VLLVQPQLDQLGHAGGLVVLEFADQLVHGDHALLLAFERRELRLELHDGVGIVAGNAAGADRLGVPCGCGRFLLQRDEADLPHDEGVAL